MSHCLWTLTFLAALTCVIQDFCPKNLVRYMYVYLLESTSSNSAIGTHTSHWGHVKFLHFPNLIVYLHSCHSVPASGPTAILWKIQTLKSPQLQMFDYYLKPHQRLHPCISYKEQVFLLRNESVLFHMPLSLQLCSLFFIHCKIVFCKHWHLSTAMW
jgi:hypothetical protein